MGRPYSSELDRFSETYEWACRQDIDSLRHFLLRWIGHHVFVVGSGGSYSAAVVAALFREIAHGSPTQAITPLELISVASRVASRTLLLSAEGKNMDVLAAARASASADAATAAITLTRSNPLLDLANETDALRTFAFQMDWTKDGYLATNSLLATVLLLYRAFFEGEPDKSLSMIFSRARLAARREAISHLDGLEKVIGRRLLVLYSMKARPFAVDLESKLSEAALAPVQICDFRQFAHGRHLQLASREPPVLLSVFSNIEAPLARATTSPVSSEVETIELEVEGTTDQDLAVAGLIDAMFLTEAIARHGPGDPGQPDVPEFGKRIHRLDVGTLLSPSIPSLSRLEIAARRKESIATRTETLNELTVEAAKVFAQRLAQARFKALVCDFDGTLCRAEDRFEGMPPYLVDILTRLIEQGMILAIASGRGDSLRDDLFRRFPAHLHKLIHVGYYSGSVLQLLGDTFAKADPNPEFGLLLDWVKKSAYARFWKPLGQAARGGQLSLRVHSPTQSQRFRGAIRAWLDTTGRREWRVYCSGHSVDVLDPSTSKRLVVERLAAEYSLDPTTEILRIGDCGHEDGNDYELLRNGIGLSCDSVSADLDSCWNFGPNGCNQAEVTALYLRCLQSTDDSFKLDMSQLLPWSPEQHDEA